MRRCLIVFLIPSLLAGCGWSRAAKERAAAGEKRRAEHMALLKSYVPENVLKTVGPKFYTESGFRDWWRIPLVYPYSIHCIDSLDSGRLCIDDRKAEFPACENIVQGLRTLIRFNFDGRYLVGYTADEGQQPAAGEVIPRWALIDFTTGAIDSFGAKDELTAAAQKRGYSGDMEFARDETLSG
jgi:hypothetical protein